MKLINFLSLVFILVTVISCTEDDKTDYKAGTVVIDLDHKFGANQLDFFLNQEYTHPLLNEKMTFETFNYYVSNIRLKNSDGTWFSMPESYFLVELNKSGSNLLSIPNVPGGEYTAVEITYGVDSLRNVSGAQTGALDPANGMFWSWNTGYIMLKAEGKSPAAANGSFVFHLGGFKGENKIQTTYNYEIGKLVVDGDREAEIHMIANPARLWHTAEPLATRSTLMMPGVIAHNMSSDFYSGIAFDHIHN